MKFSVLGEFIVAHLIAGVMLQEIIFVLTVKKLVESNLEYFTGSKEDEANLIEAEQKLEIKLSDDFKWLLVHQGYGICTVTPNLQESVMDTLRFRANASLPVQYFVLEDLNDAGVILFDTESACGAVVWLGNHCINELNTRKIEDISDSDFFSSLALWLEFKLNEAIEEDL